MPEVIDVVVRCRNEMPHVQRTLAALRRQVAPRSRVLFIDCGSTDGSRDGAVEHGAAIVDLEPASYVPGAVLNRALERTSSEIVAFVNADAVPLAADSLGRLTAPLRASQRIAAAFGRQLPRPDASPLTRLDHGRAFGEDQPLRTARGRFFSMAASAVRREAWQQLPFDETLAYSEDVDWVRRISALGWQSAYAPAAEFEKSREYDLRGHFRRRSGEGAADTLIYHLGAPSLARELLRPLGGSLLRDGRAGALSPRGVAVRIAQSAGYFSGRARGLPGRGR